jgi:cellulose synthase (UDP-forming)
VARAALWSGRLVLVAAAVLIGLERPGPWLSAAAFAFGLGLARAGGWRGRQARLIAFGLAVFTSAVNYLSWRLSVVAIGGHPVPGAVIGIPLYLAEVHAAVHTMGLHIGLWPRRGAPNAPESAYGRRYVPEAERVDPYQYPIFVFVPTVDEGEEVLRPTLTGVLAAREAYLEQYPDAEITIVVCDDGLVAGKSTVPEIEALCVELGVMHVVRTVGGGAKAGNINHAREVAGAMGECLLSIFDADQIPRPDFFLRIVEPFDDPQVGWVQSGQFYGNRENPVARWADDQQSLFYRLLCPGKAAHNSAFICGTNFAMRSEAIDSIGGIPMHSVTEDFAASIRMANKGWRSVYITGILAVGLGPLDLASFFKQQDRWARGTLNIMRDHWRDLWLPRRGGMTAQQRAHYLLATTHYWCGVRDLIFCLSPILFVLTGYSGVRGATAGEFLTYFVPYFALSIAGFWHAAWNITSWRCIVINYGTFPVLLIAGIRVLMGRKGDFTLTPKRRSTLSPWRTAQMHLVVVAGCTVARLTLVTRRGGSAYWLAGFWLLYLCMMSGLHMVLVVLDSRQARRERREHAAAGGGEVLAHPLVPRPEPHEWLRKRRALPTYLGRRRPRTTFAALGLVAVLGCTLTTSAFKVPAITASPPVTGSHPYIGIGALSDYTAGPGEASRRTGVRFTMTARTLEIGASFDAGWAAQVSAVGGVPWVTLVLTDNGRTNLYSTLTAITNGSDDAELTSWARQFAAFDRPIYLTILPEVDRNYAATSAVAHGGIPQDVAPAWAHLRALFTAAGATNVGWVWSPADPGADQPYAPPADQIDAVALTLYEYAGAAWQDPAKLLAAAAARHPGKPLLVEASVQGSGPKRAAWLTRLGLAIGARHDVAAFVYAQAGPSTDVTAVTAAAWSVAADPASLSAYRTAVARTEAEVVR